MLVLTPTEFAEFQQFIHAQAGITLGPSKKALVSGRLAKRVHARNLPSYAAYHALLSSGADPAETQLAIDLLTTNETYFYREPRHFAHLAELASAQPRGTPLRVWSAASASGEEAYSIAMVVMAQRPQEAAAVTVIGTDISQRMLQRARSGHYPESRARQLPTALLHRYCLKGHGPQAGTLLVQRDVRQHVRFLSANLNEALPDTLERFDVIFLRNVMIYFDATTKQQVVQRVLERLRPGGYLYIGHSESLHGLDVKAQVVQPSIYRAMH